MQIDVVTLLPGIFDRVFDESVLGAARKNGLIDIRIHNFRDHGEGRHRTVDDTPFGGGPGMVMKPGPLVSCLQELRRQPPAGTVIGLSPAGIPLTQPLVKKLACLRRVILVCGRYEGFDDRILPEFDLQISLGDYVLTGGEFAAMTVVDAISRMIPGTVGRKESVEQDSFFSGALDHPQFTRPAEWRNRPVPPVLLEGNHAHIERWRRGKALRTTAMERPDVFASIPLTAGDREAFQASLEGEPATFK